ncbi:hypothetical protein ABK040_007083 [Willaertia magna]
MNNNNNSLPSSSTSTTTSITALNNNNNTTTTTIHNNNETINNNNNQQPSLTHSHTLRTSLDILDITDIRKTFNNHKKNLSNNNINKLIQKFHHFKQIHKQLKKETIFLIINSFLTLCFGLSGFAFGILYLVMIILEYTKVRDDDDTNNNNNNTNESNNKTDIFSHWSVFVSIGCFIVFAIFSLTSYRALQTYREEKKKKKLMERNNEGMMNDNNNSLVSPTATSSSVNNIVMDRSNGHCNNNVEEEKHIVTPMLSELKDVLASDSPHINDLHQ